MQGPDWVQARYRYRQKSSAQGLDDTPEAKLLPIQPLRFIHKDDYSPIGTCACACTLGTKITVRHQCYTTSAQLQVQTSGAGCLERRVGMVRCEHTNTFGFQERLPFKSELPKSLLEVPLGLSHVEVEHKREETALERLLFQKLQEACLATLRRRCHHYSVMLLQVRRVLHAGLSTHSHHLSAQPSLFVFDIPHVYCPLLAH